MSEAPSATRLSWLRRLSVLCVAMTILLMGLGAWVKANGAGLACPDWPSCYGSYLPPFPSQENGRLWHGEPVGFSEAQELYEWTHRAVVSLLFVPLATFALLALGTKGINPMLRRLPAGGVLLYVGQAGLGAVTVVTGNPPWATTAHLVTATLFLTTLVSAAAVARLRPLADPAPEAAAPPKPRAVSFVYPDEPAAAPAAVAAEAEAHDA